MAADTAEGLGTVCWWGLSPALDLHQHLPPDLDPAAEAAVLLVGAAEGRHILLTAARARRGPPPAITLFVAEQRPEAVARQLLFLLLALEAPGRTGPAARAAALLELLGSVRLRPATAGTLRGAAARLRRWVTGDRHREEPREPGRGAARDGPADLRLMKCRDRDALEAVLRRWERPEPVPGGVPEPPRGSEQPVPVPEPSRGWERRLRRRLGARFEARAAAAEWELRWGLHPRGAAAVSPEEFGLWRESGVAFVPGGGHSGDPPNPTLWSSREPRADGELGPDPGFWGDTVTGPFLAFGLDGTPGKTATETSLAKVTELLREILTGDPPGDPPLDHRDPPPGHRDPPPDHRDPPPDHRDPPLDHRDPPPGHRDPPLDHRDPPLDHRDPPLDHRDPPLEDRDPPGDDGDPLGPLVPPPLRVRFLPLGSARCPPPRARLEGLCRLLVLGWRSVPELTPQLGRLAAPGATLLVELPTFAPTLRQPQLDAVRARVEAQARASGFQPWGGPGEPPACARFRRDPHD